MIKIRTASLAAIALAVGMLAAPPATGAATWLLPAANLSDASQNASESRVAAAQDGTTTAVWRRDDGTTYRVQVATRPAGANAFGPATTLSEAGGQALQPEVAVGTDGATTVVWDRFDGTNYRSQAVTRPAGSTTFGPVATLSTGATDAQNSQVAVGPDGTTTVVWEIFDGAHYIVQQATRPAGSTTFGPATDLTPATTDARHPQVAIGAGGTTTVVWEFDDGVSKEVKAATRASGSSTFGAIQTLSTPGSNAKSPRIAMGPNDLTTVVWDQPGATFTVQATTRPNGSGAFSAPETLSAAGGDATTPSVATGQDGTTTVAWFRSNGTNNIVQTRTRSAGAGSFGSVQDLSATGQNAYNPEVAAGPDGLAAIAWYRNDGTNDIVQAATRSRGATTFDTPVSLSTTGQNAGTQHVAVAGDGTVTVTWHRYNGTKDVVQAASTQPQPKLKQKPLDKKGKAPKKIKKSGKTVITGKNAKTNAGNSITTKVKCKPKKNSGKKTCKVIRGSNGKVTLRTYGVPKLKVTVTQSAPETPAYLPYSKKTVYKNGKKKS